MPDPSGVRAPRLTKVTTTGRFMVGPTSSCWEGSTAPPPQLAPPAIDGRKTDPCNVGGVYRPSLRYFAIWWRQAQRSNGVKPHASLGRRLVGVMTGVTVGKGWVGESCSPGTS